MKNCIKLDFNKFLSENNIDVSINKKIIIEHDEDKIKEKQNNNKITKVKEENNVEKNKAEASKSIKKEDIKQKKFNLTDDFLNNIKQFENNEKEKKNKELEIIKEKERKAKALKELEEFKKKPIIKNEPTNNKQNIKKEEKKESVIKEEPKIVEIKQETKEDEFTINKNFIDVNKIKDDVIEGNIKKIDELNIKENVYIEELEKQNEEYMTIYYILNNNTDNPEFLDDDVLIISKKEAELRELKKQKEEEYNFQLEELTDDDKIKVDLTEIMKEINEEK